MTTSQGAGPLDGHERRGHSSGLRKSNVGTMADQGGRYAAYTTRLVDGVLASPGHTPAELRRAVLARAFGAPGEDIPPALAAYIDKVARHASTVTDDDVAALQRAGHSDDALFELTVSAALGAALGRLQRGLAALPGEPRSVSERGEEPRSSPPDPLPPSAPPPPPPPPLRG